MLFFFDSCRQQQQQKDEDCRLSISRPFIFFYFFVCFRFRLVIFFFCFILMVMSCWIVSRNVVSPHSPTLYSFVVCYILLHDDSTSGSVAAAYSLSLSVCCLHKKDTEEKSKPTRTLLSHGVVKSAAIQKLISSLSFVFSWLTYTYSVCCELLVATFFFFLQFTYVGQGELCFSVWQLGETSNSSSSTRQAIKFKIINKKKKTHTHIQLESVAVWFSGPRTYIRTVRNRTWRQRQSYPIPSLSRPYPEIVH